MKTEMYYSIPEAAKTCGVSRTTMWKWVKSGRINAFITPGGHHRILREEMDRFLEEHFSVASVRPAANSILIVDDDPLVLEMFQHRLKGGGYHVETASDGFMAGIKLTRSIPDLVVLDIFMDNMDGFEVCRTIRGNPELSHTRILAFTGMDTPENRKKIVQEGADDYLPKTVDFNTVMQHIESLLGTAGGK